MEPGSATYNVPMAAKLDRQLDLTVLRTAVNDLVARHESLRTTFCDSDDGPVQIIAPELLLDIRELDLSHADDEQLRSTLRELAHQPFNLANGPLLHVYVLQLANSECILMICMHHIICDAWSQSILLAELAAYYEAHKYGRPANLPPLPLQYADYAVWQRECLTVPELERQLAYWKNQLRDAPPLINLPLDRPRPAIETHAGAMRSLRISERLTKRLGELGRQLGCTQFALLLAAFNVLLARYSGDHDIVVGTPISGRRRSELEGIVGFFLNTLAIRTDTSGNPRFSELVDAHPAGNRSMPLPTRTCHSKSWSRNCSQFATSAMRRYSRCCSC